MTFLYRWACMIVIFALGLAGQLLPQPFGQLAAIACGWSLAKVWEMRRRRPLRFFPAFVPSVPPGAVRPKPIVVPRSGSFDMTMRGERLSHATLHFTDPKDVARLQKEDADPSGGYRYSVEDRKQ